MTKRKKKKRNEDERESSEIRKREKGGAMLGERPTRLELILNEFLYSTYAPLPWCCSLFIGVLGVGVGVEFTSFFNYYFMGDIYS